MSAQPLIASGVVMLAALLGWLGARWTRSLPHYEAQRRAVPSRDGVVVALAVVGALVALWQGGAWVSRAFLALWGVVFALVAVVDIETHFIPDALIFPATLLALLVSLVDPRLSPVGSLVGAAVGFVLFFIIVLLARGGFGMGDAKLCAFIGAVTGLLPLVYALTVGIFAGGIGAAFLLATGRMGRRAYMPYGPYLCLGGWIGMLPAMLRFWGIGG